MQRCHDFLSTQIRKTGLVVSALAGGVSLDPGKNLTADGCVYRRGYCDMQPWARAAPYCTA